jgi:broad specificity phosphatase PhoE
VGIVSGLNDEGKAREQKIVLIRHGRSAHVHVGWIDQAGFLRWREAYEAAGIVPGEVPPLELREVAANAGLLVASDIPRAIESAHLLAPGARVEVSPRFRELALVPPDLGRLRLPLTVWALVYGVRMLFRKASHVTPAEEERAREAAGWLAERAAEHGTVVVVTHATFRGVLAKALQAEGWRCEVPRRRSAPWSAWAFSR